jgi:hypothetical protein
MSSCPLGHRDRALAVVGRLGARRDVLDTDLISPGTDPTGQWTVEIAIDDNCVPSAVLQILADEGLSIRESGPRAGCHIVVAVV